MLCSPISHLCSVLAHPSDCRVRSHRALGLAIAPLGDPSILPPCYLVAAHAVIIRVVPSTDMVAWSTLPSGHERFVDVPRCHAPDSSPFSRARTGSRAFTPNASFAPSRSSSTTTRVVKDSSRGHFFVDLWLTWANLFGVVPRARVPSHALSHIIS